MAVKKKSEALVAEEIEHPSGLGFWNPFGHLKIHVIGNEIYPVMILINQFYGEPILYRSDLSVQVFHLDNSRDQIGSAVALVEIGHDANGVIDKRQGIR